VAPAGEIHPAADGSAVADAITAAIEEIDRAEREVRGTSASASRSSAARADALFLLGAAFTFGFLLAAHLVLLRGRRERHRAEGVAARLATIVESADEAIFSVGLDGRIDSWNAAAERLYGAPSRETRGEPSERLVPESRREEWRRGLRAALAGQVVHLESECHRSDGALVPIALSLTPIRDASGAISGASSVARDISQRLAAERALRESEERLELVVRASNDGLWDWDIPSGRVFYSERLQQLLGFRAGELAPTPDALRELVHPEDRSPLALPPATPGDVPRLAFDDDEGDDAGPPRDVECRLRRKDGTYGWFRARGQIILAADGTPMRSCGMLSDVTARKHGDEKLHTYLAEADAARRHAERQAMELARLNDELRVARQDAQEASRLKSEFLANMSHELRTPMTSILGFADLLDDPKLSAGARADYLETIRRSGSHLLEIVSDILDLSKIEAGRMEIERIAFDLPGLIDDVVAVIRPRAEEKGLAFDAVYLTPLPAQVETDPTRLRQILLNLLGNAVKFTDRGAVRLEASVDRETSEHGPRLLFSVVDSGIGMSEAQLARLFQVFTQADASTTRRFGGTGLGLSISQKLAALLGGEIGVQSAPGLGSRFTVAIACVPVAGTARVARPDELLRTPSAESRPEPVSLAGRRVLLAEDGPDNQRLLSLHLRNAGAEVAFAATGVEAREKAVGAVADGRPFDLVLMDMQMPELDGYAATSELRAAGYRGAIVALTANAMHGDRERCLRAGCSDFIAKPVAKDTLLQTAARWMPAGRVVKLDDHRAAAARAVSPPTAPAAAPSPPGQAAAAPPAGEPPDGGAIPPLVSELSGDGDMAEVLGEFVGGLPERVAAMQRCAADRDLQGLRRLAHQMSGAAGCYGFPQITDAARRLEAAAAASGDVARGLADLAALCRRARATALCA
jgi:PAS domain S-box-containing protein